MFWQDVNIVLTPPITRLVTHNMDMPRLWNINTIDMHLSCFSQTLHEIASLPYFSILRIAFWNYSCSVTARHPLHRIVYQPVHYRVTIIKRWTMVWTTMTSVSCLIPAVSLSVHNQSGSKLNWRRRLLAQVYVAISTWWRNKGQRFSEVAVLVLTRVAESES